ncbi:MAG: helix-turn-helix domain-containing protein [Clostridiales bacterium]|nr:helix-turn-helix domain-containing protein [Clostridiales bacterium]
MITIEQIQEKLREAIRTAPITKKELAKKLGINQSTVSKYLHQDKYPSLETFANICKILDVSSDEILCLI